MCLEESFAGKNSEIKIIFLKSFREFELMIFRILAKNVANITKAAFYLSRLTFCQKNVLEKKNSTLAVFQGKTLISSVWKSLAEISEGTYFAKKVIRIIYWIWERKFQTSLTKFPAELSKQHSTDPEDEFQERNCFWKYDFSNSPRNGEELFGL